MKNIVSWSGGKDSTATVILAHEHNIPIDEIVMAVLWFDKSRNISAILPEHWKFITEVAKPKFEEWGYKVTFVDAKKDYVEEFYHIVGNGTRRPERIGKHRGFLIGGMCKMTGYKQETIARIKKQYADCIDYQGIAIDEPERLERMHNRPNNRSLLEEYNLTEEQAKELCRKYGLLSPIYDTAIVRDGCWFCPNARLYEKALLKQGHPELWHELEKLSQEPNLVSPYFSRGKTFAEIDREVDEYIKRPKQISIEEIFPKIFLTKQILVDKPVAVWYYKYKQGDKPERSE